ncbi:MAG: tetratricopeptide repeat protein [Candidatus Atribacteria bacterium]|nr:tetratricopeptide repeat protein [Candidatus Atribacteria bacterium]MCD6349476.1 tetratricopeptide repeat protein [Candidatus Atribacteria bacterium]
MIAKRFLETAVLMVLLVISSVACAAESNFQEKIVDAIEKVSAWGEPIMLEDKTLIPIFGLRLQAGPEKVLVETIPQAVLVLEPEKHYTINLENEHPFFEIPPEDIYKALLISAQKHLANNDLEKAKTLLEKNISVFPEKAENHALLGKALFALYKKTPESFKKEEYGIRAFMEFAKALELDPQNQEALLARARARLEVPEPLGSPELALEDLSRVIQQNPGQPEAYVLLGKAYLALNRPEKAKINFHKALELDPENPEAREGLAQIEENL